MKAGVARCGGLIHRWPGGGTVKGGGGDFAADARQ